MVQIQRERLLPAPGEIVTGVGQEVTPVQVVARTPKDSEFLILNASEQLKITPEELAEFVQVEPKAAIEIGEVLVKKRGFPRAKVLESPISGTFYGVRNGRIILKQSPDWIQLRAMVHGRVVNIIQNRGVVLEINGSLIQAIWGSDKEGNGPLKLISRTADAELMGEQLSSETNSHIIAVGRLTDPGILQQAEVNEIRGIIAGSMPADLLAAAQAVSFPILLTDGIGDQRMAAPIFQMLLQSDGQEVSLFGQPQQESARASNRPEIIIPQQGTASESIASLFKPLAVGQIVRILRAPYQNQLGEVQKLHSKSRTVGIMKKVQGADITLTNGQVVFVPYANLDALG
jgi:hypothetical protein